MKRGSNWMAWTALAGAGTGMVVWALRNREKISFNRRVVVISGGSRGLGLALAREFVAEGAYLALLARSEVELRRALQQLAALNARGVEIFPCDVSQQSEVEAALEQIVDRFGRIDVLINNAGVIQVGPLEHMTVEDFEEAMSVHFWGPLYASLAAVPYMRRQGQGRIVNISSIGGKVAVPHLAPYSSSKFALVGLSDGLRAELDKYGIRVTTVCPGLMRTGSYFNAKFKGEHQREYTWFSIFDALPVTSTSAVNAARQIIEACRRGDAQLIITIQARLLALANELLPGLTATGMKIFNRFLPDYNGPAGDQLKTGWESQSDWSPSRLTRLGDKVIVKNNQVRGSEASLEERRQVEKAKERIFDGSYQE